MEFLATLFIEPLRISYEGLFALIRLLVPKCGPALLILSLVTVLLMRPLERMVKSVVAREQLMESVLTPQIAVIKAKYQGVEQHMALKRLYARYGYSPIYSIRATLGVLIQIPFLMGAYWMLSGYEPLAGQSFGPLRDLSQPDGLVAGFNVLPVVMTAVNLATVFVSGMRRKEAIQAAVIALLFLVLLYDAPSALLLYWTMNNVLHFLRAIARPFVAACKIVCAKIKSIASNSKTVSAICEKLFVRMDHESGLSWAVMVFLAILTPASLSWFGNLSYYGPADVMTSLWLAVALAMALIAALWAVSILCKTKFAKRYFLTFVLILSAVLFYQTGYTLHAEFGNSAVKIVGAILAIFVMARIGGIKLVNIVLAVQMVCAVSVGAYESFNANSSMLRSIEANASGSIKLKETPNIYYVLCESMNSLDIAEKVYGYDQADDFRKFLKDYGFYVPEGMHTNSDHTLPTLVNVFSMNEKVEGGVGRQDISTAGRDLIAGGNGNKLLGILKDNGYEVSHFFKGDTYFYYKKGPMVDHSDISAPVSALNPALRTKGLVRSVANKIKKRADRKAGPVGAGIETDSVRIIQNYVKTAGSGPRFFFHRMDYTNHTAGFEVYNYKLANQWIDSRWYLERYKEEVAALKEYVKTIVKSDPNAVIVFLGDHGAWRYRADIVKKSDLRKVLGEIGDSYGAFLDDRFKVFAAVRVPEKYGTIGDGFSSANVFAKIFDLIGYEGDRLRIAPNESYASHIEFASGKPVLINGKPVEFK